MAVPSVNRPTDTEERERRRLGREVHDWINEYLVDIYQQVNTISVPDAGATVARISERLREANAGLRRIMNDLHPHLLEELGLCAALSTLALEFEERTDIRCVLALDLYEAGLGAAEQLAVFRIVQEALANVRCHSRARTVSVSVKDEGNAIAFRVADDGIGFARCGRLDGGMGLVSMAERAASVGGRLAVTSAVSRGTVVEGQIPTGAPT